MRLFRLVTLCCAVVLTAALATAQQTDLDLPITDPRHVVVAGKPLAPEPPTEDPRDEPPPVLYGEEIDSESDSIFYVIDISGSMDWDNQSYTGLDGGRRTGNRMERAKTELSRSIMGLSRNFKFNVLAYDCATRMWAQGMQQADDANKASAIGWVRGLQPAGATGTGPATAQALGADRSNMSVVLLTDGAPNCGVEGGDAPMAGQSVAERHRAMIRTANAQHATINVFGISANGYYRTFCQNVASDSGGSYFDIP